MKRMLAGVGVAAIGAAAVLGIAVINRDNGPSDVVAPVVEPRPEVATSVAGPQPGVAAAVGPRFTNVAAAAGLTFTHVSGASGRYYFVEQWGSGAAFLDYDNDGWLDVFLAQGGALPGFEGPPPPGNRLFRNLGNGTFADVTDAAGLASRRYTLGAAVADYDNDGDADLFVTALGGNVLYENNGRGGFSDVTRTAGVSGQALSTSAAFLDYDSDGRLDLFVARYQDYDLATDRACETAASGFPDPPPPPTPPGMPPAARVPQIEYCGPGKPEVANQLFHNEGSGVFRDASASTGIGASKARGLGVTVADFNEDGRIDVFVASDRAPNQLFLNRGKGTFTEGAAAAGVAVGPEGFAYAGMGVDAADYDDDGHIDLVITNYENQQLSLYRNRGNGTFSDESQTSGLTPLVWKFMQWGVRLVDLNGDGRKDLFVANGHIFPRQGEGTPLGTPIAQTRKGYAQEAQVIVQKDGGAFAEVSVEAGPFFAERRVYRGAAFADYDNDGDWDALVTSIDGPTALLRNDTSVNRWARLVLEGTVSNRDAIGAVVRLTAGGRTQTAIVSSGGSYLSDHDRRLLFALPADGPVSAVIRWPCGATQTVDVPPGVTTRIRESGCGARSGGSFER